MNNYNSMFRMPALLSAILFLVAATAFQACAGRRSTSAASESVSPDKPELKFSGDSAMALVERQVAFGPRKPGTAAHAATGKWLEESLAKSGAKVYTQKATLKTFDGVQIPMTNILASLNPDAEKRMLVIAHWDTRPWADQDSDPAKRKEPVAGANDGASGTAVILELARVLANNGNLKCGVDFLLVDAEDWGDEGDDESWAMGARHFVNNPPDSVWKIPEGAIVVDMVGDANATFRPEYFSQQSAPGLNSRIWAIAKELGYGNYFINEPGGAVTDDHIPFIEMGIPAVDIVDYRMQPEQGFAPQWHTTRDTPDLLSAKTLQSVGRTLEYLMLTTE